MKEHGLDYKGLADVLGISEYAVYRRLRGFSEWKLPEAIRLSQYFSVCSVAWLFQCDCE
jgi:plasmid maintenance system antidote protein VapI